MPEPAATAPPDVIAALFAATGSRRFQAEHFERGALLDHCSLPAALDMEDVFPMLATARQAGDLRVLRRDTPVTGLAAEVIDAELAAHGGDAAPGYRALFAAGLSFAVQNFERYFEAVREVCDGLAQRFDTKVSTTAFATPGHCASTPAHYDQADVFVLQLAGEKRWQVSEPLVPLTSPRIPRRDVAALRREPCAVYRLRPGASLYLPRGWIHEVDNPYDCASLHVSFVVFSDSWISLFGNAMDAAYSRLRLSPRWRESVTRSSLRAQGFDTQLNALIDEFTGHLRDAAGADISAFCDYLRNDRGHAAQRAAAAGSLECLAGDSADALLHRSGAHFIARDLESDGFIRLSADEQQFYRIPLPVWDFLQHSAQPARLSALQQQTHCSTDTLAECVDVLVARLGIYRLEAA
jgi:Cupin superfamily protein